MIIKICEHCGSRLGLMADNHRTTFYVSSYKDWSTIKVSLSAKEMEEERERKKRIDCIVSDWGYSSGDED